MRLRLRISSAYSLGDFQWSMVHVPEHAHTVGDFAGHVSRLLELGVRGGDGELPQFLLEGFLVPHSEELRVVLRDDEVVDVERSDRITGFGGCTAVALSALPAGPALQALTGPSAAGAAGKRSAADSAAASDKRQRRSTPGGDAVAAPLALGWQAPSGGASAAGASGGARAATSAAVAGTKPASVPKKAAPPAAAESSSSDDESEAPATTKAAAASAAKQAALATCGRIAAEATAGSASGENSGRGIFVGGLPPNVDDAALGRHFAPYGAVESSSVACNPSGKPKGFGFVEFVDASSCQKLLAEGSTQVIAGKQVEVKLKQSKGAGKDKGAKEKGGKGGKAGKEAGKAAKASKDNKSSTQQEGKGSKPRLAAPPQESSSSSSDDEEPAPATQAPKASAELTAPVTAGAKRKRAAQVAATDEELELQKQMAALGLPVSFVASEHRDGEDSDEEEEEEEDDEE